MNCHPDGKSVEVVEFSLPKTWDSEAHLSTCEGLFPCFLCSVGPGVNWMAP
jgi:hypothetical protein